MIGNVYIMLVTDGVNFLCTHYITQYLCACVHAYKSWPWGVTATIREHSHRAVHQLAVYNWANLSKPHTSAFNVEFCLCGPSLYGLSYCKSDAYNATCKTFYSMMCGVWTPWRMRNKAEKAPVGCRRQKQMERHIFMIISGSMWCQHYSISKAD